MTFNNRVHVEWNVFTVPGLWTYFYSKVVNSKNFKVLNFKLYPNSQHFNLYVIPDLFFFFFEPVQLDWTLFLGRIFGTYGNGKWIDLLCFINTYIYKNIYISHTTPLTHHSIHVGAVLTSWEGLFEYTDSTMKPTGRRVVSEFIELDWVWELKGGSYSDFWEEFQIRLYCEWTEPEQIRKTYTKQRS